MRAPTRHRFVLFSAIALIVGLFGLAPPAQAADPQPAAMPRVTTVLPQTGPLGGTLVQIKGTDLAEATVRFGTVEAEVQAQNDSTILVTAPPIANPAMVSVNVEVQGSGTSYWGFEYLDPETIPSPQITSVHPKSASTSGGRLVSIIGTGLANAGMPRATVSIGDVEVDSLDVVDNYSDRITVIAPPHVAAADLPITVETAKGPAMSPAGQGFTYFDVPPPAIASISPDAGPRNGGQTVTIKGTHLWDPAFPESPQVRVGNSLLQDVAVVDNQTLTGRTRPSEWAPGPQDVWVSTAVGEDTLPRAYMYVDPPAITAVEPATGHAVGSDTVLIRGYNLVGVTAVEFDGVPATGVQDDGSGNLVTVVTPAHAPGAVNVVVRAAGGSTTRTAGFTYLDSPILQPEINAVSPSTGPISGGQPVEITGSGLSGATKVWFGDNEATEVVSIDDTTVSATTPAGTVGSVTVKVQTPAGTAAEPNAYTYVSPEPPATPVVTSVTPATGTTAGGQQVTITGNHLAGASSVMFGGKSATAVAVVNATTITAKTPAHGAGKVTVAVTTPLGTGSRTQAYTYVAPPPPPPVKPTITKVQPASGTTAGGQQVTVTGTRLTGTSKVLFGGKPATGLKVVNATTVTARTPGHAAGKVTVSVTAATGTATKAAAYAYVAPPPPKPKPPAAPTGVTYSPGGRGTQPATTVMWLNSPRATGYQVQVAGKTVSQTEQTRCVVNRVVGPKTSVRVRALGAGGASAWTAATWRRGAPGVVLDQVRFGPRRATLTDASKKKLRAVAALVKAEGLPSIVVTGHTDKVPGVRNPKHGDAIALARAKAVRTSLQNQLGKAKVTITVKSRGDRDPVASNATKDGRKANRRAVITLP